MEIHNDFQENGDNAPKLVASKKNQPAITGPIKVLFLDDHVPFLSLFSNIHLFAKMFVANKMQDSVFTPINLDGAPTECIGSGGSYATYFSIPECKSEQDVQKVVSAINNADVIVCGGLSGNVLGFNFGLNTKLGSFAEAVAKRVSNGFKNIIRYNSKEDLSNCLECFKELPPIVERGQNAYGKIFELIKQMQPKRNFIQNHKIESVVTVGVIVGLCYEYFSGDSKNSSVKALRGVFKG